MMQVISIKNSWLQIALILFMNAVYAQKGSLPVYKQFPTVPPFSLIAAPDSISFSKEDLTKKPVLIVVFSPDCEHCRQFTKDLLANYQLVKKAQIIMSSALNYNIIKKFYEEFKIADYPQIIVGRDRTNF